MRISTAVSIGAGRHGNALICLAPIAAGEALLLIDGPHVSSAGKYTVQVSERVHVEPAGAEWALLNHSCDPNCAIDFATWRLRSRAPIAPGAEITFNYLSTEWELASPFDCHCGAPHCPGAIRGYRHLRRPQRDAIHALVSPFLLRKALKEPEHS